MRRKVKVLLSYLLIVSLLLPTVTAIASVPALEGGYEVEQLDVLTGSEVEAIYDMELAETDPEEVLEDESESQIIWNEPTFTSDFTDVEATGFTNGWQPHNLPINFQTEVISGSAVKFFYIQPTNSGNRYHDARGMFTGHDVGEMTFYIRPGYAQPSNGFHRIFFEDRTPVSNFLGIRAVPLEEAGRVKLEWQRYNGVYSVIPGCEDIDALDWYRIVFTFDYVKDTITIKVGDITTLEAGTADNRKPEWPIIDMVNCFSTTIDNTFAIREYTVRTGNYKRPEPVSVSLNVDELSLSYGAGSQPSNRVGTLTATVLPAEARQDIIWTTSDAAVAKISNTGVVTAIGEGVATIRATSTNEDVYAECEVSVTYIAGTHEPLYDNLTVKFSSDFSSLPATGFDAGNASRNVDNGYLAVNAWGSGGRSAFNDFDSGTEDIVEYHFGWRPGYAMPRQNWYEIYFESLTPSIMPIFAIRQVSTQTPDVVDLQYWVDDGRPGRSLDRATWTDIPGYQGVSASAWYDLTVTFNYLTREMWLQIDDYRTETLRFTGNRVGRTHLNGWRINNWSDTDVNHISLGLRKYSISTGEYTGPRPDPESVIISQTSAKLIFGPGSIPEYNDRVQLTAEVLPYHALNDITWTSSDPSLVSVDENGLVQVIATNAEDDGKTVTITATAVSQEEGIPGAYAECLVTIIWEDYIPQPYIPDFDDILPDYDYVIGTDFRFEDGTWLFAGEQRSVIENIDGEEVLNFYLHHEILGAAGSRGTTAEIEPTLNRQLGPGAYIYFDWNTGWHTPLEIRFKNWDTQVLTLRSLGGDNGVAAYAGSEFSNWNQDDPTMILPEGIKPDSWYSFGIEFDFDNMTVSVTAWERGKSFDDESILGTYTFELIGDQKEINRMEILHIRAGGNVWSTTLLDNVFILRKKETNDTITKINVWHDPVKWPDKQPAPEGNYLAARQYCVIPVGEDWRGYLPEQVLCELEDGTSRYIDVTWLQPAYHNNGVKKEQYKFSIDKPGLYTFIGVLKEEAGVAVNKKQLPVEAYVEYRIQADPSKTNHKERSAEWLDRGVVAMPVADRNGPLEDSNGQSGILVSWRMLASEYNTGLKFNVYRNGEKINESPIDKLNYVDSNGKPGDRYKVEAVPLPGITTDGEIMSKEVAAWNNPEHNNGPFPYFDIILQKPKDRPCIANGIGCPSDCVVTYSINDTTAADVDGDGQYEILVQWITHGRDSSHIGYMAESIFDCYTLDGKLLWRINRGYNIGSGAHYPAMHFYDLDEDGKAEFAMKTGVGTRMFLPKEDGTIDDTTDIPEWVLRTVDDNRSSGKIWTDLGNGQYSGIDIPYAEPIWVRGTEADINDDPRDANWPIYINGFFGSGPMWQGGGGEYNGVDPAYPAGKILQSPEFISVFDGLTAAPKKNGTLPYFAPFDLYGPFWGDGYGNRGDRFLGAIAYLPKNGIPGADPYPSIIEVRGQYGPGDVAAYQWVDNELKLIWHYKPVSPDSPAYQGSSHGGNHNMSVADVDFDGYDEILTGGTAINEDGSILWATDDKNGRPLAGHGDALHVSVMQPDTNEYYIVLPQEGPPRYGALALNGSNGELIWGFGSNDTGRGAAFNVTPLPGFEVWGSGIPIFNVKNGQYIRDSFFTNDSVWAENPIPNAISVNHGVYWDGDLMRELLDQWSGRPHITKFYYNADNPASSTVEGWWRLEGTGMNNGSKANPSLTLDLFGDWREEILVRRHDENALRIFSSNIPTDNVIYTLMHDPTYRLAVSWQNGGYNQPPHLGFYLGEDIADKVAAMGLPVPDLRYTSIPSPVATYTIIASAGKGGTINPSGTMTLSEGSSQVFTITPDQNYRILSVVVDGVEQGAITTYTINNINKDHSIHVTFEYIEEPVTPSPTPPITPSPTPPVTPSPTPPVTPSPTPPVTPSPTPPLTPSPTPPVTPSPTPPVTPSPTPQVTPTPATSSTQEIKKTVQIELDGVSGTIDINIYNVDKDGKVKVMVDLTSDEILSDIDEKGSSDKPLEINVPIAPEDLLEDLEDENVKDVNIKIQLSSSLQNNDKANTNIILPKNILETLKDNKKNIDISVVDEKEKEIYIWSITGEDLANSNNNITDISLSLTVQALEQEETDKFVSNKNAKALLIKFSHEGALPSQATVRIYVGNNEGLEPDNLIYLYSGSDKTDKLQTLPYSSAYKVDEDGFININILKGSNYVVLTKKADNKAIISLRDQIQIYLSETTLYIDDTKGSYTNIHVELPLTLELVGDLEDKTSSSAIGAVTVTYKSNNDKVATVDSDGNITAKGKGIARIIAIVNLYSGKTKVVVTNLYVK